MTSPGRSSSVVSQTLLTIFCLFFFFCLPVFPGAAPSHPSLSLSPSCWTEKSVMVTALPVWSVGLGSFGLFDTKTFGFSSPEALLCPPPQVTACLGPGRVATNFSFLGQLSKSFLHFLFFLLLFFFLTLTTTIKGFHIDPFFGQKGWNLDVLKHFKRSTKKL